MPGAGGARAEGDAAGACPSLPRGGAHGVVDPNKARAPLKITGRQLSGLGAIWDIFISRIGLKGIIFRSFCSKVLQGPTRVLTGVIKVQFKPTASLPRPLGCSGREGLDSFQSVHGFVIQLPASSD